MNKKPNPGILATQILTKMGTSDEFLVEALTESKPSRIENRRDREKQHEERKRTKRGFNSWND